MCGIAGLFSSKLSPAEREAAVEEAKGVRLRVLTSILPTISKYQFPQTDPFDLNHIRQTMKVRNILTLLLAGLAVLLSSCAPRTDVAPVRESISAKKPVASFSISAALSLEDLTLEDYAVLNRDMDGLLRRSGITSGKGYLIPFLGIHGGTHPMLTIEGDADPGAELGSNEGLKAAVDRFSAECEKALRRSKEIQKESLKRGGQRSNSTG